MRFIIALIFSILVLSMILLSIEGMYSNTTNNKNNNNTIDAAVHVGDERVELLKAKRGQSDGPTILAYIVIAAAVIVPHVPQID
jgi:hypothetical protein